MYDSRQPPPPRLPNTPQFRTKMPLLGGTISISIEPRKGTMKGGDTNTSSGSGHTPNTAHPSSSTAPHPPNTAHPPTVPRPAGAPASAPPHPTGRSHIDQVLHDLSTTSKLRRTYGVAGAASKRASDEVERLCLGVRWSPEPGALGFVTNPKEWITQYEIVSIRRMCLCDGVHVFVCWLAYGIGLFLIVVV